MAKERWHEVTRDHPCPACGRDHHCAWTPDRRRLKCERATKPPPEMKRLRYKGSGALFAFVRETVAPGPCAGRLARGSGKNRRSAPLAPTVSHRPTDQLQRLHDEFRRAIDPAQVAAIANALGVLATGADILEVGWATRAQLRELKAGGKGWSDRYPDGAYTFPERDRSGRLIGFFFRTLDGRHGSPAGLHRGLIVPTTLGKSSGIVLVVEGASDVWALVSLDIPCIGRPSCAAGGDLITEQLNGREFVIVGERDQKRNGRWPGRDGARSVASHVAAKTGRPASWTLPPEGSKDVRDWLNRRVRAGMRLDDEGARAAARDDLLRALQTHAHIVEAEAASIAEQVVRLANEKYRFGLSLEGRAFAVAKDGPNASAWIRSEDFRAHLCRLARERCGRVLRGPMVADVVEQLSGLVLDQPREELYLRTAWHGDDLVIDLATPDGAAIIVSKGSWRLVERAPVTFRRSETSLPLPVPEAGGSLDELFRYINADIGSRSLVLGWLLASFDPSIPRPILILRGEYGTGKSNLARLLLSLTDPGDLSSVPRNQEDWVVSLTGCSVACFDNISEIPPWLADYLCKACTGDALKRRKRFSDDQIVVLRFKRAIILTTIDPGVLRGDLLDRSLIIDLERRAAADRRPERELERARAESHAKMFGAVLDLLAKVVAEIPRLPRMAHTRMADFELVLAAMDRVIGSSSLDAYRAQKSSATEQLLEGDELAQALLDQFPPGTTEAMNMKSLLQRLKERGATGKRFRTPESLSGAIRRLMPSLRGAGLDVTIPGPTDKKRLYTFARIAGPTAQTARPPDPVEPRLADGHPPPGGPTGDRPDQPPDLGPGQDESVHQQ